MATTEAELQAALMTRLATLTTSPTLTVVYRERRGELPAGPYVMVDYMPNDPERIALQGSEPLRHTGILQLMVARPLGLYDVAYRETAATVAAHFARDARLTNGSSTVAILKTTVGQGRADGEHWAIPVSIYWRSEL